MAVVRRRLVVAGRVQGVWFRDSCQQRALELALSGSVRNLNDGRVEIVAEGEADAVDRLEAWAHHGPPRALVTAVSVTEEAPTGEHGFRVSG
ncbi:MAG: acylphosphatase [Acidimicrobiaceae bacterium]|jgi:acylphosphatase